MMNNPIYDAAAVEEEEYSSCTSPDAPMLFAKQVAPADSSFFFFLL
jgi:hypothetical protein